MSDPKPIPPCLVCHRPTPNRCSKCHIAYYCSTECQKNDRINHKPYCFPPEKLIVKIYRETMLMPDIMQKVRARWMDESITHRTNSLTDVITLDRDYNRAYTHVDLESLESITRTYPGTLSKFLEIKQHDFRQVIVVFMKAKIYYTYIVQCFLINANDPTGKSDAE